MAGLTTFHLALHLTDLAERAARITNELVNLSTVLPKYHEFTDIFSKTKAKILALHYLYNLQIKLENRENPSVRIIYLLSTTKQEALKKFISEKSQH